MDVFSLKFWRDASVGDPINSCDPDDEGSFFDIVFTNPNSPTVNVISGFHNDYYHYFSKLVGDSKSTLQTVLFNNKNKILPLDSSNSTNSSKAPKSPFRVLKLRFQNNLLKLEKKEIKCEIEEVTISSLLNQDNSLRNKLRSEKLLDHDQIYSKRFSKEIVHKYLNLIKVKVSKRNNEKVRLPESSPFKSSYSETASPFGKTMLKEVRKQLGKSRSSSSFSGGVKNIPPSAVRRDDSALQQHDGIQSAILHCKQSYNSPSQGCNMLSRSGSAPSHGSQISIDEAKNAASGD